jgi:hypothetical protein
MKEKIVLSSIACLLFATPAQAGWWDVLGTISNTVNTIGYTKSQVTNLMGTLGISESNVNLEEAKTGSDVAIELYKGWREGLPLTDQALADQLIIEYATGTMAAREQLAVTPWFQALAPQEKMSVLGLYADFEKIVALVDDESAFIAGVL